MDIENVLLPTVSHCVDELKTGFHTDNLQGIVVGNENNIIDIISIIIFTIRWFEIKINNFTKFEVFFFLLKPLGVKFDY